MNKRVFHIDQECFIIFVEELSSKKERFLRIGNSPVIKDFGENLTFVSLLSKLYPGDIFHELDIFRPKVDKKVIGFKENTTNFLTFLKKNGIDTDKVKTIFAEEEGKWYNTVIKDEKEFIEKMEKNEKNKKLINHSFASFYKDGNIRVFNKSEIIFDLQEALMNTLDIKKEILQLSRYFIDFYKNSYKKSGIVYSDKSLFVFSNNSFACITDSKSWVKDAIRVGINPFDIDLIYFTENVVPDSLWIKFFISYERREKGVKLLVKEKPNWDRIIPQDNVVFLNPFSKSVKHDLGDVKLFFHKKKIIITFDGMILAFQDDEAFLNEKSFIKGEYNENSKKIKFKLMVDEFDKESLALYSYNPCVFERKLNKDDYVKNFWKELKFNKKDFKENTDLNDSAYEESFIPKTNKKDFYPMLFAETIKRIHAEGNKKISDEIINDYIEKLAHFNGELINKNNLIIEQVIGFSPKHNRIVVRDRISENNFVFLENHANPFLSFEKDESKIDWGKKLNDFRVNYKKKVEDAEINNKISKRFLDVIDKKQFHIEEQERLRRFLEKVIIKEQQTEKINNKDKSVNNVNKESEKKKDTSHERKEKKLSFFARIRNFISSHKISTAFISALFLVLLILGLLLFFKGHALDNQLNNQLVDKLKVFKKDNGKYKILRDGYKQSSKFQFYMTMLDLLNLTNKVAVDNGYHRIVYKFQKRRVKGKDPDWIFPNNKLKMPDKNIVVVKDKDTMWDICEVFLIDQLNKHELQIEQIIKDTNKKKITMDKAKEELLKIKAESYSEMLKDLMDYMVTLDNFGEVEKVIKEGVKKVKK